MESDLLVAAKDTVTILLNGKRATDLHRKPRHFLSGGCHQVKRITPQEVFIRRERKKKKKKNWQFLQFVSLCAFWPKNGEYEKRIKFLIGRYNSPPFTPGKRM